MEAAIESYIKRAVDQSQMVTSLEDFNLIDVELNNNEGGIVTFAKETNRAP